MWLLSNGRQKQMESRCSLKQKLLMNIIETFLINKTFNVLFLLKNPVFHLIAHSMGSDSTANFPICHSNKVIYHRV